MNILTVPQGEFLLERYPERKNGPLRAWDAADGYLLRELHETETLPQQQKCLIINDCFGSLSVALANLHPQTMSDSYLAHLGTQNNLQKNNLSVDLIKYLTSLDQPDGPLDLVLIKIPKTLALLEDQLHRIRPYLHAGTQIIGAGMVKGIHTSTLQLFERIIGPTHTSLARQKARLIHCQFDSELNPGNSPYPSSYILEGTDYRIINHANVFSRERLDSGTRLFLEQVPSSLEPKRIIDLGCGNGIVGLITAKRNPTAELVFVDESYMAVATAEANFKEAFGTTRTAQFLATNCLEGIPSCSVDQILNNPPFHQQSAVGDQVAWEMFQMSREVLKSRGELLVIGNRHLGYHTKLKRLFGNCEIVGNNRKFVVLKSIKSSK